MAGAGVLEDLGRTAFATTVATVVEHHRHQAAITVTPTLVGVVLSTPAANGLTEKDFLLVAALEFGS